MTATPDGPAPPAPRAGEYRLVRRLGAGGFGEVWLGEHRFLPGRRAAVKVPHGAREVGRLHREGVLQARLDAPEVVRVLGMDLEHAPPFVVYEFVEGPTLAEILPLEPRRALDLLAQVAAALAHAHARGVVHGDLKPANILLDPAGRAHVTDFGLGAPAVSPEDDLSLSRGLDSVPAAVTLAYTAPEQRVPGPVDARADVYAFGVVLFEAVTGRLPSGLERPGEARSSLPAAIDALYERCCAPIERRPEDGEALLAALSSTTREIPAPGPALWWSDRPSIAWRERDA